MSNSSRRSSRASSTSRTRPAPTRSRGFRCGCRRTASPDPHPACRGEPARRARNRGGCHPGRGVARPLDDQRVTDEPPGRRPPTVKFTVTNKGAILDNDIGCVEVSIPGAFEVLDTGVVDTPSGKAWDFGDSGGSGLGRVAVYRADSHSDALEGGLLSGDELAVFSVRVDAGSAGGSTWTARAWSDRSCDGGLFAQKSISITVSPAVTPRPSPTRRRRRPPSRTRRRHPRQRRSRHQARRCCPRCRRCQACSRLGRRRRPPDPTRPRRQRRRRRRRPARRIDRHRVLNRGTHRHRPRQRPRPRQGPAPRLRRLR